MWFFFFICGFCSFVCFGVGSVCPGFFMVFGFFSVCLLFDWVFLNTDQKPKPDREECHI